MGSFFVFKTMYPDEFQAWKYDQQYNEVCNFLGITPTQRVNDRVQKRVSYVLAKAGRGKGINEAMLELQKTRKSLGVNFTGEKLLNELYQTMRLHGAIEQERANFGSIATQDELRKEEKKKQSEAKAKEQLKLVEKQIEDERNKIKEIENNIAQQNGVYATT